MSKSSIASALALTLALALPAFAQTGPPPAQNPPPTAAPERQAPDRQAPARAAQPTMVSGELVNVDTTAKSITVKTADNNEVKFLYTDKTDVSGAKDGAAGLATLTDAKVTVHFTEDAQSKTKTATRIIVEPKK